ncbi:MAG: CPBP family glutamic-type intramembrane protease [Oscillospiraceae bacterium]|nr:CPBP family glutamic-type intramembrane protease [Oscillospiraceae bacterium]
MKNNTVRLSILLASFVSLWVIISVFQSTAIWFVIINIVAICIIAKYKNADKKAVFLGFVFGIICIPSSVIMGISVILPYIASVCVFKKSSNKIYIFNNGKKSWPVITLILTFVVGGVLGFINILFALSAMAINPSFNIQWFIDALRAGVFEEIFFRLFFFALCIIVTKDKPLSRMQNILCYIIMIVPHVLIHFNLQSFNIGSFIMLSLLFGLPFAIMQRKVNLISAIGVHSFVDLLRFCVLGV